MPFIQYFKWGAIIFVLIAILGAYFHYKSVVSERDLLAQNNASLQLAFDAEQKATKKLRDLLSDSYARFERLEVTIESLNIAQNKARKELEVLNGKFRKHDLEKLAKKKPGLIENRLNNGTRDTFRMLEKSTDFGTDRNSSE